MGVQLMCVFFYVHEFVLVVVIAEKNLWSTS